jgi:hypothetical protein
LVVDVLVDVQNVSLNIIGTQIVITNNTDRVNVVLVASDSVRDKGALVNFNLEVSTFKMFNRLDRLVFCELVHAVNSGSNNRSNSGDRAKHQSEGSHALVSGKGSTKASKTFKSAGSENLGFENFTLKSTCVAQLLKMGNLLHFTDVGHVSVVK